MDIIEASTLTIKKTCSILQLNPGRYYDWQRRFNLSEMEGLKTINQLLNRFLTLY